MLTTAGQTTGDGATSDRSRRSPSAELPGQTMVDGGASAGRWGSLSAWPGGPAGAAAAGSGRRTPVMGGPRVPTALLGDLLGLQRSLGNRGVTRLIGARTAPAADVGGDVQRTTIAHKDSPPRRSGVWKHATQQMQAPGDPRKERAGEVEALVDPLEVIKPIPTANGYDPLGWHWVSQFVVAGVAANNAQLAHQGWVRFHLLNATLGGDGHDPAHLVPTKSATNTGNPWVNFEYNAKAQPFLGKWLHYHVEVGFHPPGTAGQVGDPHLAFFPSSIRAEYSTWDPMFGVWAPGMTVDIPANQLQVPNAAANTQTHYIDGISAGEFPILGVPDWLAVRVGKASRDLARVTTLQQLYDDLVYYAHLDRGNVSNPLAAVNAAWPALEVLLRANTGHHLRIAVGVAPMDRVLRRARLTPQQFQRWVQAEPGRIAAAWKVSQDVVLALDAVLTAPQPLTSTNLYLMLEQRHGLPYMAAQIDPDWPAMVARMSREGEVSIQLAHDMRFASVSSRLQELRNESHRGGQTIATLIEQYALQLGEGGEVFRAAVREAPGRLGRLLAGLQIAPSRNLLLPTQSKVSLDDILMGMDMSQRSESQFTSAIPGVEAAVREAYAQVRAEFQKVQDRARQAQEQQRREQEERRALEAQERQRREQDRQARMEVQAPVVEERPRERRFEDNPRRGRDYEEDPRRGWDYEDERYDRRRERSPGGGRYPRGPGYRTEPYRLGGGADYHDRRRQDERRDHGDHDDRPRGDRDRYGRDDRPRGGYQGPHGRRYDDPRGRQNY
ncbi:hypothetical protein [Occultella kanbiaonis]|uniref:hypothetical protein n=1 Tax=Occultella kanbiaonis TaxID=2675754 RepID=UPI0012B6D352|nr:hypothetical protein [Occultella kanbiaonis]